MRMLAFAGCVQGNYVHKEQWSPVTNKKLVGHVLWEKSAMCSRPCARVALAGHTYNFMCKFFHTK